MWQQICVEDDCDKDTNANVEECSYIVKRDNHTPSVLANGYVQENKDSYHTICK